MFRSTSFIHLVTIIIIHLQTIHCFFYMMVRSMSMSMSMPSLGDADIDRVQKKCVVNKEKEEEENLEKYLRFDELPVGYRFLPTDIELIDYLKTKVSFEPIPNPIQDIEAATFYSRPPNKLEWNPPIETKDMFFFIHHTDDSYSHTPSTRIVADGIGCWKPNGVEKKIYRLPRHIEIGNNDADGDKSIYTYFRGKPPVGKELPKLKKTAWVMHEYHLPQEYYSHSSPKMEGKWVLGRIKCGGKNTYTN